MPYPRLEKATAIIYHPISEDEFHNITWDSGTTIKCHYFRESAIVKVEGIYIRTSGRISCLPSIVVSINDQITLLGGSVRYTISGIHLQPDALTGDAFKQVIYLGE
jgi:hypothetical protein